MKRYRKMIPLATVTEKMIKENDNPEFRKALLKALPKKIFGEAIATNITQVDVLDTCLQITIPNDTWRNELTKRKRMILEKAREIHDSIQKIDLIP